MPTASPPRSRRSDRQGAIDPRIRERRTEVLRAQATRRLRVALAVLVVVLLAVGAWFALHSRIFAARVVTVVGAGHTPTAEIIAAAGLTDHPPLIDVTGAAAAGVERLPWVATATVSREWPDGVRVTVVERTPVAAVALAAPAGTSALVDRTGRVLADTAQVPAGLVTLGGTGAPGAPGTTLAGASAALRVAASLPKAFAAQVTEVVQSGGQVTLHLTSPLTVDLGSTVDLHQKYEDVAAILGGSSLVAGDVIDVSAPGQPVVRA